MIYTEEDNKIRFSTLKKDRKWDKNHFSFKNKSDFDYKICYDNNCSKLIALHSHLLVIKFSDKKEEIINYYKSSPKLVIKALASLENKTFTPETFQRLHHYIDRFTIEYYDINQIEKLEDLLKITKDKKKKKEIKKRIEVFYNSKNEFVEITRAIINCKQKLNKKLNSSFTPKRTKRLEGKINKVDLLRQITRYKKISAATRSAQQFEACQE